MLIPTTFAALLGVALLSLIFAIRNDGIADGERVEIALSGACLTDATPIISKRIEAVGLADPELIQSGKKLTIKVTLPAIDNAQQSIPKLLSRRGIFQIRHNGNVILENSDVVSAKLSLDEAGLPEAMLSLEKHAQPRLQKYLDEHQADLSEIWLDEQFVINRPNTINVGDEFRLVSEETDPKIKMKQSADFVILFTHGVLPCEITLDSVQLID